MNIAQILAKATKEVDLVKDGNIYYLLLNQGDVDFTFTDKIIIQINAILDEVEKSTGPAVLVTVSAAKKRFSTGFSLEHFSEN